MAHELAGVGLRSFPKLGSLRFAFSLFSTGGASAGALIEEADYVDADRLPGIAFRPEHTRPEMGFHTTAL
jgi:hypothetical protein